MSVAVKICGIQDAEAFRVTADCGARYAGFVFEPGSRRYIAPEKAGELARNKPGRLNTVGLFVDPTDEELRNVLNQAHLDIVQLHGLETPERVAAVHVLTGLPVMKAIHIATESDLDKVAAFEAVADVLLFDTKTGPKPTGGTGKAFNWQLLKGRRFAKPWLLAGGLNAGNLAEAVAVTGARGVDLSSGVEDATGRKDPEKIRACMALAAETGSQELADQ